jgi:uncharacterized repeat protein (TIGR03803 family)
MNRTLPLACFASYFLGFVLIGLGQGNAQVQFQVVHAFGGPGDGFGIGDSIVVDAEGNLYGTAGIGGAYNLGTVFELSPGVDGNWTETILYDFGSSGPEDGKYPGGPVALGGGGVLYGATSEGGEHDRGLIYSLAPGPTAWGEAILHNFTYADYVDGLANNLVLDAEGNLFGGAGTFELSPGPEGWTFSRTCDRIKVYTGNNYANTALAAGDRLAAAGNSGGKYRVGDVYAVVPTPNGWQAADLYDFRATGGDGQIPSFGPLVADSAGNIYGVTSQGGSDVCGNADCGTIYRLSRQADGTWQETILYNFANPSAGTGFNPTAGVILDKAGNLYGTAYYGGNACGCGVVYRLSHHQDDTWTYTVLHKFIGFDGTSPFSALTFDSQGNLFGTTEFGGPVYNGGVVFEISRPDAPVPAD